MFINQGLLPGERVVVDGAIRLSPGAIVKVIDAPAPLSAPAGVPSGAAPGTEPAGASGAAVESRVDTNPRESPDTVQPP